MQQEFISAINLTQKCHSPSLIFNDFHVIEATSVITIVSNCTPKITPSADCTNEHRPDDSALLLYEKLEHVLVVQMTDRINVEECVATFQQAVVPELKKNTH